MTRGVNSCPQLFKAQRETGLNQKKKKGLCQHSRGLYAFRSQGPVSAATEKGGGRKRKGAEDGWALRNLPHTLLSSVGRPPTLPFLGPSDSRDSRWWGGLGIHKHPGEVSWSGSAGQAHGNLGPPIVPALSSLAARAMV